MYGFADPDDPDTIRIPFIFVPRGHPPPTDWLRDHPGAFRVPAVFVPRSGNGQPARLEIDMEALAHATAGQKPAESQSMEDPSSVIRARSVRPYPVPGPPIFIPDTVETYRLLRRWWTEPQWESHPKWENEPPLPGAMESNPRPDRNAGLPGPLRAYTYRARKSAEAADAATKEALHQNDQRLHHLINAHAAQDFGDLLMAASRTGWVMDEPANVITLPANEAAQAKLAARGILLPFHDNGHPGWNEEVTAALTTIRESALLTFGVQDSEAKDLFIRWRMEVLQTSLRIKLPGMKRVVENITEQTSQT